MMNGPEKSDSAIVATKLANKAQPSAERSAGEPYAASSPHERSDMRDGKRPGCRVAHSGYACRKGPS